MSFTDGLVTAEVPENALFTAPDGNLGRMAPLERETYLRTMSAAVSVESAKMVAKVLKEKPRVRPAVRKPSLKEARRISKAPAVPRGLRT